CSHPSCAGERTEDKRRSTAGADPNDNIAIFYSPLPHGQRAPALFVLRAFDAAIKRWYSAGDYSLHEIRRRAKCRRNFARIEDADATAAASADVKQAPTIPARSSHH